jgi:hypothetical protein
LERIDLAALLEAASSRVAKSAECIVLRYKDSDGDDLSLSNSEDLNAAVENQPSNLKVYCSLKEISAIETSSSSISHPSPTLPSAGLPVWLKSVKLVFKRSNYF